MPAARTAEGIGAMDSGNDGEAGNRRAQRPERGDAQHLVSVFEAKLADYVPMGDPMTPEKAYEMGYRHISDLAAMTRVASMVEIERLSATAVALMDAWREGAMAAKAMLEKQSSTLQ